MTVPADDAPPDEVLQAEAEARGEEEPFPQWAEREYSRVASKAPVRRLPADELTDLNADEYGARLLSEISTEAPPPRLLGRWDATGISLLYGPSGAGKGVFTAGEICKLVAEGHRVLVIDYETHPDEWARRVSSLGDWRVMRNVMIFTPLDTSSWRAPTGPLWAVAPVVREFADDFGATIAVVDSIGAACLGASLNEPVTAQQYTQALATIGRPSVSIGQVNRARDMTSPFGSTHWLYYCRAAWSIEKTGQRTNSDGEVHNFVLTDRKANNYARAEALHVIVEWVDGRPTHMSEKSWTLELADRIAAVLAGEGVLGADEITEILNISAQDAAEEVRGDSVRKTLYRGSISTPPRFAKAGRKWVIA